MPGWFRILVEVGFGGSRMISLLTAIMGKKLYGKEEERGKWGLYSKEHRKRG